jgi:nitrate/TMAO reductase-like tetraheme cytochrome c subunit
MQTSGATSTQMTSAMSRMQTKLDKHQVIDHVEDNIDTLLARLE